MMFLVSVLHDQCLISLTFLYQDQYPSAS